MYISLRIYWYSFLAFLYLNRTIETQTALAPKAETRDNTHGVLETILSSVKNIESDLMVSKSGSSSNFVDPVANFPVLTPKHKSLAAGVLLNRPDLYTKYCNSKTPGGFTFDDVIQAGIDAPHLGVGAVAGDEESYETFRDFMDAVIEGWHGYKPTDKHRIDIDPSNIKLTDGQAKKFDQYVISTRIRAGRSIRGLPLPPGTNRAQRRKVRPSYMCCRPIGEKYHSTMPPQQFIEHSVLGLRFIFFGSW